MSAEQMKVHEQRWKERVKNYEFEQRRKEIIKQKKEAAKAIPVNIRKEFSVRTG